jgi:hypothetical protein
MTAPSSSNRIQYIQINGKIFLTVGLNCVVEVDFVCLLLSYLHLMSMQGSALASICEDMKVEYS